MEDRRLLKDYRSYLKIERSMSPNTVSAYSRDVAAFLEWADSLRREVRGTSLLAAITQEDIVGYMQSMPEKTVSKRSQARALSSLRSFFNWSVMEGYLKGNPCDGIDSPKLGRYLPAVIYLSRENDITFHKEMLDVRGRPFREPVGVRHSN